MRAQIFIWYLRSRQSKAVLREKNNNKKAFAKRLAAEKMKQEQYEKDLQQAQKESEHRALVAEKLGQTTTAKMLRRGYWRIVLGQCQDCFSGWRSNMHADKTATLTREAESRRETIDSLEKQVQKEKDNLISVLDRHGIASATAKSEFEKQLAACRTQGERDALIKANEAKKQERKEQALNRMRGILKVFSGEYANPVRLRSLIAKWLWQTELHIIQREQEEKRHLLEVKGALSLRSVSKNFMVRRLCYTVNTIREEVLRHVTYRWRSNQMLAIVQDVKHELDAISEAREQLEEQKRLEMQRKKISLITMTIHRWSDGCRWRAVSTWSRGAKAFFYQKSMEEQISAIEKNFAGEKKALELSMENMAQLHTDSTSAKAKRVEDERIALRKKQAAGMCLACLIRIRKMWKLKALAGFRWNLKEDLMLIRELDLIAQMHDGEKKYDLGQRGASRNFAIAMLRRTFHNARQTGATRVKPI